MREQFAIAFPKRDAYLSVPYFACYSLLNERSFETTCCAPLFRRYSKNHNLQFSPIDEQRVNYTTKNFPPFRIWMCVIIGNNA